jgi:hypothetical protein
VTFGAAGVLGVALALLSGLAPAASAQFPGKVLRQQKISSLEGGLVGPLHDQDLFGVGVARIGDLDDDGIADLAVGAYLDDDGGDMRGAVYILFMNTDGTVRAEQKISSTQGDFGGPLDDMDIFGWSVAALGDLDGDGVEDIAAGAWLDDDGAGFAMDTGAVWILFLTKAGTVKSWAKISAASGGFTGQLDPGDRLGSSLTAFGDLDGDGVTELAVGALYDDDGNVNCGCVYILFLRADGTVKYTQKISATEGHFHGPLVVNDRFGYSSARIGDFNHDGHADLAVGSLLDGDGGLQHGALWILFLSAEGTVLGQQKISSLQGGFTGVLDDFDTFGRSVSNVGDLNHDGVLDLAVGSGGDDDGVDGAGAVWILFLKPDGTVAAHQKISMTEGDFAGPLDELDDFGQSCANIGDLDGDGVIELAVGAITDDDGGQDRGAVWILSLSDGTWNNPGYALAGTLGKPSLDGQGPLTPASPMSLTLKHALGGAKAVLFTGFSAVNAPFKGGVMVPSVTPPSFPLPMTTPSAGNLVLSTEWPPGIPAGATVWFQFWIADPAGPFHAAASNGLSATAH